MSIRIGAIALTFILSVATQAQQPTDIVHHVVAQEDGKFHGWPANNGAWHWGNEILVGFTQGDFLVKDSHNITGIEESHFARSLDGGETWTTFDPDNFLDDDNVKWLPKGKTMLQEPMDFSNDGFAMRLFGTGYHGNDDPKGGFYYSYDRGATWKGPHFLGTIPEQPMFEGMDMCPRTDYIITGPKECFVFIMAAISGGESGARVAVIHTTDGGLNFEFVSWVTPLTEDYRSIMPSSVRVSEDRFISTTRRINKKGATVSGVVEAYVSNDRCKTWQYLSTLKEIKTHSNPPAIVQLTDGRLCCVYGDRDTATINGKYSTDGGVSWGDEFLIRDGYESDDWSDMGYPRLVQRPDGKLVCMYYYASAEHVEPYIAASIWTP